MNNIVRGFCATKNQHDHLAEYGVEPKSIWLAGRSGETIDRCLATFRGRAGTLLVAHDLRVFAESRKGVTALMGRLERANIRVVDISHPEDTTVAALVQRANVAISGSRFRDRRTAKRRGATGGLAKGASARSARAQIDTDTLIRNLVAEHRSIGWPTIVRICGGNVSQSTLRRHYLGDATNGR